VASGHGVCRDIMVTMMVMVMATETMFFDSRFAFEKTVFPLSLGSVLGIFYSTCRRGEPHSFSDRAVFLPLLARHALLCRHFTCVCLNLVVPQVDRTHYGLL
jgi:hypothetical protein